MSMFVSILIVSTLFLALFLIQGCHERLRNIDNTLRELDDHIAEYMRWWREDGR